MNRILQRALEVLAVYRSAIAAGSAVDNGRRPLPRDLRQLGIDVAAFGAIARA
jgi:hypothetical protein